MSLGRLTILSGLGGLEETQVVVGEENGQVLLVQGKKAMVIDVSETAVLHTWFSSNTNTITTAARNKDVFDNCSYVIAYNGQMLTRVGNLGTKLEAFPKTKLDKEVKSIFALHNGHYLVFKDGSVGLLSKLIEDESEKKYDAQQSDGILEDGTNLIDVYLYEEGDALTFLLYITEKGNNIYLHKSRLKMNVDTREPFLASTLVTKLGTKDEILVWDVYTGDKPFVLVWKTSGEIMYSSLFSETWEEIFKLEHCTDAAITALTENYFAVMYTKKDEDKGKLQIISINLQCVSSETTLKTTVHIGKGLYFVGGYIFIVGGGRVGLATVSNLTSKINDHIGCYVTTDFDNDIEKLPSSMKLYRLLPNLYKQQNVNEIVALLTKSVDVPEDILVDFLSYVTDSKQNLTIKDQKNYLKQVMGFGYCEIELVGELSRLRLEQVLLLLEIILSWLDENPNAESERRLLSWLDHLIANHYIQIVVSKDERTISIMEQVFQRVFQLERYLAELRDMNTCMTNLINIQAPPIEEEEGDERERLPCTIQFLNL